MNLDLAAERYVTAGFAAHVTGRPERTIRTWAYFGVIRIRHEDGRLFVSLEDAVTESATRQRRRRVRVAA